ncbi:hypothetical protein PPYR_00978 [Photinus pyralis]|uniref:Aftiphilin clathrin-binding box domain-containing protein n=1 Tax=Photinus pyralis TaxID=7054 RepID=A0A5N4B399_PHOPY|nr:uncharacterized protein LOC116163726 isoform X3 [Photinus pyralis]KAB0804008.1 hypothetical protein PPYR_00978 [Photinus pyralis]
MSNIIPPLLSSSPPPMVGTISLDDDDEFGTFTMAADLHSDADVTVSSPTCELPIPKIDSIEEELDRRKGENGLDECVTKYNSFQYYPDIPPDISSKVCDLDEDDKEISEILETELSNCTVVNDIKPVDVDASSPHSEGDFADFDVYKQDDEIFEGTSGLASLNVEPEIPEDKVDEEFGDFNDYSVQSSCSVDWPSNLDDTVKVMFPTLENITEEFVDEDITSANVIFVQLKDITDTPALSYQWSKSSSQSCLLQALNIDTRNILYGPRWNESMPRYAATLGYAPLQPVKSDGPSGADVANESVQPAEIPSAEFDWVGSGLVNPLEITPPKVEKPQLNNGTAQHANESITQTKLESNNTNIPVEVFDKAETDFDDFHCFQSGKVEEPAYDSWPMSLRETHISNVKLDDPSWLQPTILTPELPRKELRNGDEFANFQSGTSESVQDASEPPTSRSDIAASDILDPCKLEPISNTDTSIPVVPEDDDEFTEFQSTSCLPPTEPAICEPLQPSILQPVKIESQQPSAASTTINWPDPGITEEDLQRFSLYKPAAKEPVVESDKKAEEDDWSDFVSNQTEQLNNSHLNQSVQNGFQSTLVSNQYVVFASKPDEVEEEWNDFVSSEPPPAPPVFTRPPRTSLPKLNLDWNSPPQFSSWSSSIAPNIIANPTSFESFQSFTTFDGDLLKNRIANKKTPNILVQPKMNAVPSISTIPDLEFIAPKNRTWKK